MHGRTLGNTPGSTRCGARYVSAVAITIIHISGVSVTKQKTTGHEITTSTNTTTKLLMTGTQTSINNINMYTTTVVAVLIIPI